MAVSRRFCRRLAARFVAPRRALAAGSTDRASAEVFVAGARSVGGGNDSAANAGASAPSIDADATAGSSAIDADAATRLRAASVDHHGTLVFEFGRMLDVDEMNALTAVFGENEFAPGMITGYGRGER